MLNKIGDFQPKDIISFGVLQALVEYGVGNVERETFLGIVSALTLSPEAALIAENTHVNLSDYVDLVGPSGESLSTTAEGEGLWWDDYSYIAIKRDDNSIVYIGEYFVVGELRKHTTNSTSIRIDKFDIDSHRDLLINYIKVLGYQVSDVTVTVN